MVVQATPDPKALQHINPASTQLVFSPSQRLRHLGPDGSGTPGFLRLRESIARHSILQPLGVRPGEPGFWNVVFGNGRGLAALALGLGTVPAVVLPEGMTEAEYLLLRWVENDHRTALEPIEQVDAVEEFARTNPDLNNKKLGALLQIEPGMVTTLRSVYRLCEEIPEARAALTAKQIVLTGVYEISKATTLEAKKQLLAMALTKKVTRKQIEQARSNKPDSSGKAKKVECVLPGNLRVVVESGDGISLDQSIKALTAALKAMKKARDDGYSAKTFAAAMADAAAMKNKAQPAAN